MGRPCPEKHRDEASDLLARCLSEQLPFSTVFSFVRQRAEKGCGTIRILLRYLLNFSCCAPAPLFSVTPIDSLSSLHQQSFSSSANDGCEYPPTAPKACSRASSWTLFERLRKMEVYWSFCLTLPAFSNITEQNNRYDVLYFTTEV